MNSLSSMPLPVADHLSLDYATKQQLGLIYTTIFEHLGYFTTPGKGHSIQGIDYIIYKPDFSEPEIALRCRPDATRVGTAPITRFWDTITDRGYTRGIFVSNKEFTSAAKELAAGRDLLLIDAEDLERGLDDLPQNVRQSIIRCLGTIREVNIDRPAPGIDTTSDAITQQEQTQADALRETREQSSQPKKTAQLNDLTPSRSKASLPTPTGTWERKKNAARKKRTALAALAPVALVAATVLFWNVTNSEQNLPGTPAAYSTAAAPTELPPEDDGILDPAARKYLAEMDFAELED